MTSACHRASGAQLVVGRCRSLGRKNVLLRGAHGAGFARLSTHSRSGSLHSGGCYEGASYAD
eukprot:1839747-Prymnesium_polylepis.1